MWPKRKKKPHHPQAVTIAAPVDVVKDAAKSWGRDLGWHQIDETKFWNWSKIIDSPETHNRLLFRPYRWFNMTSWRQCELGIVVTFHEMEEGTKVEFAMESGVEYSRETGLRVCEGFRHGMCSDLAARGFSVDPPEAGIALQNRERLKKIASWRSRIQWGCVIGGIAILLACYWGLTKFIKDDSSLWAIPFAGVFLLLIFVMIGNLIRERSIRSPGTYQIVALVTILPLWLSGVVLVVLYWLGLVTIT